MISQGNKIVAIASSTGGPKALQELIPLLPSNLNAPLVLVQHMPAGFTRALADRLNDLSQITVSEAKEGELLERGHLLMSMGGKHMNVDRTAAGKHRIRYSDEPSREGVKPCANYMFESLINSGFSEIVCVVLTGMGADGTAGIRALKQQKKVTVIVQSEETCTVYGMPKAAVKAGLATQGLDLQSIAREIIKNVGVC
ncbi:MAG: chemotaxis protein CheB [Lachnospiraceae bacterium]|nr:chemotaxis protein CheB [Lachnospiraceae bacterium]